MDEVNIPPQDQPAKPKVKEMKLPLIGSKFMIGEERYEVVYLNEGKKRFTSIPCETD